MNNAYLNILYSFRTSPYRIFISIHLEQRCKDYHWFDVRGHVQKSYVYGRDEMHVHSPMLHFFFRKYYLHAVYVFLEDLVVEIGEYVVFGQIFEKHSIMKYEAWVCMRM